MKRRSDESLSSTYRKAARRWRVAEQERSAAVARSALTGRPEALVAWIWLAPSLVRPEERARLPRKASGSGSRSS